MSTQSEHSEFEQTSDKEEQKIKVLLVDDHQMMREGLKRIIDAEEDMKVIAEASDGEEAISLVHKASPDIVVMDVDMPRLNGIEATKEIMSEKPPLKIIGLSLHDHEDVRNSMLNAGASAYLTKNEAFEVLCAIIRSEAKTAKE